MLTMKLPHTEVKFYPDMKSQTGLSSLRVSCKGALSNFVFSLFVVHSFQVKYGVTISNRYVMDIGGVTSFVTERNIWVGGVENIHFLV